MDPNLINKLMQQQNETGEIDFKKIMAMVSGEMNGIMSSMGMKVEPEKVDEAMGVINNIIDSGNINTMLSNIGEISKGLEGTDDLVKTSKLISENKSFKNMLQTITPPPVVGDSLKEKTSISKEIKEEIVDDSEGDIDELLPTTDNMNLSLNVSLKELYCGKSNKRIRITRKNFRTKENGETEIYDEKKVLSLNIEPGMFHNSEIVLKGESDKLPNHKSGDLIIKLIMIDDPNQLFERQGDSLMLLVDINLAQNYKLQGKIITLDNRVLIMDEELSESLINTNNGVRKIIGEGMPIKGTKEKGDLYVRFRLSLPEKLTTEQLKLMEQIVGGPQELPKGKLVKPELLSEEELISDESSFYSSDDSDYESEDESEDESELDSIMGEMVNGKF